MQLPRQSQIAKQEVWDTLEVAWSKAEATIGRHRLQAWSAPLLNMLQTTQLTSPRPPDAFYALGIDLSLWRTCCLQRTIALTELELSDSSFSLTGAQFWNDRLPNWSNVTNVEMSQSVRQHPPIAPSILFPSNRSKAGPTAFRADYQEWVNEVALPRMNQLAPWMSSIPPYRVELTDRQTWLAFGRKLSLAICLQVGQKLKLTFDGWQQQDLIFNLINNTAARRQTEQDRLWPKDKQDGRVWADLCLGKLLANVLRFDPANQQGMTTFSLGVTNRVNAQKNQVAELDQLHYWHIRLAVASQIFTDMTTYLERDIKVSSSANEGEQMTDTTSSERSVPTVVTELVSAMYKQISEKGPNKRQESTRLSQLENLGLEKHLKIFQTPSYPTNCKNLPIELLSPVLEDSTFSMRLDTRWLAPVVTELSICLLVIKSKNAEIQLLIWQDYQVNEATRNRDDDSEQVITISCNGKAWSDLLSTYQLDLLEQRFEEKSLFASKADALGTGIILVGLIDLR
jgi:hypothetical protein